MKPLANLRKAVAGETLTRWVKEPTRHQGKHATAVMPVTARRTRFLSRVMAVSDMPSILVSGHSNVKIGRDVRKGALKGYWIYTLSLEERATCPSSCAHWQTCYGNAMPFAKRVDHTDPTFLPKLEAEIDRLLAVRGRKGVLIRLHALGDFYSVDYLHFWWRMLMTHDRLAVFGYTAHQLDTVIGDELNDVPRRLRGRWHVRFSNGGTPRMSTVSIKRDTDCPADAFVCPEQTGRTLACATCGACWGTTKNVAFLEHA